MDSSFRLAMLRNLVLLLVLLCSCFWRIHASVTYDHKAIIINGQRRILISGSIHYPRSTPEMWPDLIQKAKEGGLDVIQTYVFWNGHEPSPGKIAMEGFTRKIVDMMKAEGLFESQGGPIIMSQIENEYGPMEYELGAPGRAYTQWAAHMAVGLGTGVPWVMCKQDDAPDPVINACNGFYCDWFSPNKATKPKIWTENWTGWFTAFGGPVPHRPAEDIAFSVARFIQKGGAFVNYYMEYLEKYPRVRFCLYLLTGPLIFEFPVSVSWWNEFGRTSGGPFIATSYDYDAPIDEYGLLRQPKWGHLKDLHRAIKLCEPALVYSEPTVSKLGSLQEAHVFKYQAGGCAAFLANYDSRSFATVTFGNKHYNIPPWSISILPDCRNTVFNTARVGAQSAQVHMTPVGQGFAWNSFNEETAAYDDNSITTVGLMEQLNTTRDASDYLWYSTDVRIGSNEAFLRNGRSPTLVVMSAGHALHVFINGRLAGTAYGNIDNPKITFNGNVKLNAGLNKISILSISVGLPIGLTGESLNLHTLSGSSSVEWVAGSLVAQGQPLTWYKTIFNAPGGNDPLALDMGSMGKGQVWINGESIGRHWPAYKASGSCGGCNYAGTYGEKKCQSNCGEASQRWYHVPRSWLKPTGNLMVVFEEVGGNPHGISLVKRTVQSVCADIYEWQPTLMNYMMQSSGKVDRPLRPKAHLLCAPGQKISSIKFASFGTPQGACGSFSEGSCHAHKSYDVFEKGTLMQTCIGQQACTVDVTPEVFGGDPCPKVMKKLSVEAICS
ncbi:hypothetical protein Syun_026321 [Stephania yunnanensis]|uniref:Beta-galactosidase n=1 Tax=Stephania yunnanensis TaxID=152371 RepID=A0AAP0ET97_9MAGN